MLGRCGCCTGLRSREERKERRADVDAAKQTVMVVGGDARGHHQRMEALPQNVPE